ncbi:pectin methylesterase-like acyl-CoA thioesterase [Kibdelosporangium banguiense]|uniref:Pectinesterase n=1 Tax=Kibdelosporangium banguiense TaxID=1365924 RepID=A0ABS4TSM5_9PSEU|nr:pectinesterase family protein [Kibdelosporangium banguiense]MBP2327420.1 pectin methylesterase-like acyl-CoA thioesterase [Kibdelosporangium banguiense]
MRVMIAAVLTTLVTATPAHADVTITVAKDGTGNHTSVQAAINATPDRTPVTIRIKPGLYREVVTIPATKTPLTILGTSGNPADVTIDYDNASGTKKPDGSTYGTTGSATVTIAASNFTARNITFSNSFDRAAHPEITATQAVAVKTTGDRMSFDNTRFLGHQDTLYTDTPNVTTRARQYFTRSTITGDVDFIFGRATAVFDRVTITAHNRGQNPNGYVTAASTRSDNPYGILIINSRILSTASTGTYFLGRPWHPSGDPAAIAQVVIRETQLPTAIKTAPWTDMSGFSWRDARLREYRNTGPGATPGPDRPQLTDAQAGQYTVKNYLGDWTPSCCRG